MSCSRPQGTPAHVWGAMTLAFAATLLAACSSSSRAPAATSTAPPAVTATTTATPRATHHARASVATPAASAAASGRASATPAGKPATPAGGPARRMQVQARRTTCEQATDAVDAVVQPRGDTAHHVTGVDSDPACTALVLTTDLTSAKDGAAALDICRAAAPTAYALGFTSVSVRAAGRGEDERGNLSHSAGGMPCEPTPAT